MTRASDDPKVIDNRAEGRFETTLDGQLAQLAYRRDGKRLVLVHTYVPDELAGQGVGGTLVTAAIEAAAAADLTVVPICPFARSWLQKHPETAGRVTIDWSDESSMAGTEEEAPT